MTAPQQETLETLFYAREAQGPKRQRLVRGHTAEYSTAVSSQRFLLQLSVALFSYCVSILISPGSDGCIAMNDSSKPGKLGKNSHTGGLTWPFHVEY